MKTLDAWSIVGDKTHVLPKPEPYTDVKQLRDEVEYLRTEVQMLVEVVLRTDVVIAELTNCLETERQK